MKCYFLGAVAAMCASAPFFASGNQERQLRQANSRTLQEDRCVGIDLHIFNPLCVSFRWQGWESNLKAAFEEFWNANSEGECCKCFNPQQRDCGTIEFDSDPSAMWYQWTWSNPDCIGGTANYYFGDSCDEEEPQDPPVAVCISSIDIRQEGCDGKDIDPTMVDYGTSNGTTFAVHPGWVSTEWSREYTVTLTVNKGGETAQCNTKVRVGGPDDNGDGYIDWCDTKGAVVINGKTLLKIYNKYGYDTGEALKKFVSFGWVKELKNPFEYETTKGSQGHINHDLRTNFRYSDEPYAYDIYNSDYQYPFDDVDCYLRPYEDVCIRDMNRIRVEIGDFEQTVKAAGSHG